MEGTRSLIVVGALLQVVSLHLAGRNIAVVETDALTIALVIDMIVIQELQRFDACRICEHLITVETVFVSIDTAVVLSTENELEQIGEQVDLLTDRLYRIVQAGILLIGQIQLTIDITTPYYIFRHIQGCRERNERTGGNTRCSYFLLALPALLTRLIRRTLRNLLYTTLLRLCIGNLHHADG